MEKWSAGSLPARAAKMVALPKNSIFTSDIEPCLLMKLTAFRTATPADLDLVLNLVNTAYHPEPNSRSWTDEAR